jgi:hypothetical protein
MLLKYNVFLSINAALHAALVADASCDRRIVSKIFMVLHGLCAEP